MGIHSISHIWQEVLGIESLLTKRNTLPFNLSPHSFRGDRYGPVAERWLYGSLFCYFIPCIFVCGSACSTCSP